VTDPPPIYLDHNATTPLSEEVVEAMLPYLRQHFGNPSSGHAYGRTARDAVEQARARVAALIGAEADEIAFTSGGTEANNLAIRGIAELARDRRHVVTTVIEHPATAEPCLWLEAHGWRITRVAVDPGGRAHIEEASAAIGDDCALVTIMHSHNETGVLQPVTEIAALARARGAVVHTDAAQSVGKVPVRVADLGVDLLSIAGHKLYAPKGVGALYVKRGTPLAPLLRGADHERGLRPGTENVAAVVGLGVACAVAMRELEGGAARVARLRDELWRRLAAAIPGCAQNGHPELRLPNTLNLRFPGVSGAEVLAGAPEIAASTGSACHHDKGGAPAAVLAMGVAPEAARGSVRLTLGRSTSEEDVARAAEALVRSWIRSTRG
jgi:cysteine desulfurase